MCSRKAVSLALAVVAIGLGSWGGEDELGQSQALPLCAGAFPRAFHFRQSEGRAADPRGSFEEWERDFSILDGIMGKCLDEEIPNRSLRNIDFFTRYKRAHPDKAVLLHFNGDARDPRFETRRYFGGHWLYFNGCHTTRDLPGMTGVTTIHVEDPRLFLTRTGRFHDKNEDLAICMIDSDGRPDWSQCEQLELVSIDAKAKTLSVRRGAFGTEPCSFPAGSYVAAHITEGPWGSHANLLWCYNYATVCPRAPSGPTCSDVLRADLLRWFGREGPLSVFDGIEFDVLNWCCPGGQRGFRFADTNADGIADGGVIEGINVYGLGVHQHLTKLRAAIGPNRLLMADGHDTCNQRSVTALNGIESEGWPSLLDPKLRDWSGGLNRHGYWQAFAYPGRFSYINHKFHADGGPVDVPFSTTRLVLAAAQFVDGGFTFSYMPPQDGDPPLDVWDELVLGTEKRSRWLGTPLGPARHLGFDTPDILGGAGAEFPREFLLRWDSSDAVLEKTSAGLRLVGCDRTHAALHARLADIAIPEGDLLVRCLVSAKTRTDYGPGVPRLLRVGLRSSGVLVTDELPETRYCPRGDRERPLDSDGPGHLIRYWSDQTFADESHAAYFAHPPYGPGRGPGYLVWQREEVLPRQAFLQFFTGLRRAPTPSDGVTFAVEVVHDDRTITVFREHQSDHGWKQREVDLCQWQNQQVTLRFITDCGPENDPTADHAFWGDVRVLSSDELSLRPLSIPGAIMTWAGEQAFEAVFYFRDVGPRVFDLTFDVEGAEPVCIQELRLYNAPDTMVRAFTNGLVLANPSNRHYTFDLARLCPDAALRRVPGTAHQDPVTNNGKTVAGEINVPPMDALFLAVARSTTR